MSLRVAVSLVDRCVDVVDLLALSPEGLRLGAVSERLDLPKSATHRLLNALCTKGWVEQDKQSGFYRLTLRLTVLGQRYLLSTGIPDLCHPVLERLARQSRELVRLAAADGERLFWLDAAQGSSGGLIYRPGPARKVALHATAAGKAWLASLPTEHAVRIVLESGFGEDGEYGPGAVRTVEALMAALEETRARGWALSLEESEAGLAGVAAAVTAGDGGLPAAASLAVELPLARCSDARLETLGQLVVPAARELAALWPLRALPPAAELALAS